MRLAVLLVLMAPLAASGASVSPAEAVKRAKADIVRDFKDPNSAQWQNVYLNLREDGTHVVCGHVNGKNSFGAYVGFRPFYATPSMEKNEGDAMVAASKRSLADAEATLAAVTGVGQPARLSMGVSDGGAAFSSAWIAMCANGKRTYVK